MRDEFAPVTPGEMLKQEFLTEYCLSPTTSLQRQLVFVQTGSLRSFFFRRITADTALRLGLYFGNSPEFWLNLQTHYDLKMARKSLKARNGETDQVAARSLKRRLHTHFTFGRWHWRRKLSGRVARRSMRAASAGC